MRVCILTIVAVLAAWVLLHLTCARMADAQGKAVEPAASSFPQCSSVRVVLSDDQWRIVAARCSQIMTSSSFYAKVFGQQESYGVAAGVQPKFINVSLGEPRGDYYENAGLSAVPGTAQAGVYQRDFARGKALVNPSRRQASVRLDGQWKTPEGERVASPLLMPPHTGAVLLREGTR